MSIPCTRCFRLGCEWRIALEVTATTGDRTCLLLLLVASHSIPQFTSFASKSPRLDSLVGL